MKPITPQEAEAAYVARIKPKLEKLIERINEHAKSPSFTFRTQPGEHEIIREAIKVFESVGWSVKLESDQRDGDSWYVFSVKKSNLR